MSLPEEKIFDELRRKSVKAFPEEKVRQALVRWMVEALGVPPRLIAVEYPLSVLNRSSRKRADVTVWKTASEAKGGVSPWLLAECKAPTVRLTDAVADQIRGYAGEIRAEYVLVTNSIVTRYFRLSENAYREIPSLPAFGPGQKKSGK
jgi:hypothetical protein